MTGKPFCGILIYPSWNLTHPPYASSADGDYDWWVAPTATYPHVSDTAPSMIAAQKIL